MKKTPNFKLDKVVHTFKTALYDGEGVIVGRELYDTSSKSLLKLVHILAQRLAEAGAGKVEITLQEISQSDYRDKSQFENVKNEDV